MSSDPIPRADDSVSRSQADLSNPPVAPAATGPTPEPVALREHLIELGELLDLPPKRPGRLTRPTGVAVPAIRSYAARRHQLSRWLSASVIVCAIVLLTIRFWPSRPPVLPASLLGEWTTTNPRYEGRSLAFTPTAVLIGATPGAPPAHHPITGLQARTRADTTVLVLTYVVEGAAVELHAALIDRGAARLVFARPEGLVWVRRASASAAPPK